MSGLQEARIAGIVMIALALFALGVWYRRRRLTPQQRAAADAEADEMTIW